jgi:hypothetical protein
MTNPLTAEEQEALDSYAAAHGRRWKEALHADWMNAMAAWSRVAPHAAAELLRLRTASHFGARGLERHRAQPEPTGFEERLARYLAGPSLARWSRRIRAGARRPASSWSNGSRSVHRVRCLVCWGGQ